MKNEKKQKRKEKKRKIWSNENSEGLFSQQNVKMHRKIKTNEQRIWIL